MAGSLYGKKLYGGGFYSFSSYLDLSAVLVATALLSTPTLPLLFQTSATISVTIPIGPSSAKYVSGLASSITIAIDGQGNTGVVGNLPSSALSIGYISTSSLNETIGVRAVMSVSFQHQASLETGLYLAGTVDVSCDFAELIEATHDPLWQPIPYPDFPRV